ncbi:P-loop containing nucleoside triphosphate hydrolase protein [Pisolithus orientalis]|uniref:P-loop containing nucleoside triphosphate hydrolase protein n=1 Tax=Pisolithus orientalis TaxID=936130 RepID=UPI002224BB6E|nr:P-loop containing nucleoside triphosphate hydrolase protein [Pisolithus orientalis]KAI6030599.1 P-loop containing nucleoside triphosphate hydrolase protein [Pisolithus orientalis]
MGATGTGKSTFVNLASGSKLPVGRGLQSCTSDVMTSKPFILNGNIVTLIDTPGFDDTNRSDTEILRSIAAYLSNTYEQGAKLAGIIYMHRISDTRMGGTSARNFRIFRELCGESTLRNVLIVTTMWSEVSPELGEERERELASNGKFFKPVLDKGARMLRHNNTRESAHAILRHLVNAQAHTLQIQHELVNEQRDLAHTSAGVELGRLLKDQADRHEAQLKEVRREMEEAMRVKDEQSRKELQQVVDEKLSEIERIRRNAEQMAADFVAEKARLEARIADMEKENREHLRNLEEHAQRERELIAARDVAERRASDLERKLEYASTERSTKTDIPEQSARPKEKRSNHGSTPDAKERYAPRPSPNPGRTRDSNSEQGEKTRKEKNQETFVGSLFSGVISIRKAILGF